MKKNNEVELSTAELGYKYVLTLQLDRIAKAASHVKRHGSVGESSTEIYVYESHINTLENMLIPYIDANYSNEIKQIINDIQQDYAKEAQKTTQSYLERELVNLKQILALTDAKLRFLMLLLARKGLLLEVEDEEII